tara:strand:+ start:2022 stop:3449 length:1428 start_codon:yes stop_codon:yes gene_type:complete
LSKIVKATSWTTVSTVFTSGITILQISILTRYIAPEVYGQFAIINLAIEIFTAMALGGISSFIIYKKDITQKARNTVFILVMLSGCIAFTFFYFIGPMIVKLLGYHNLASPIQIAAILLIVTSLSSQYQAFALKNFAHDKIAIVEIISKILSFTIALTTVEWGIFCLLLSFISYHLFRLLGLILYLSKSINFSFNFEFSIIKEAINYGAYELGSQTLNIVRKQLDIIILASTLSTHDLGIYHVIKQLASRPAMAIQPIVNKVALPTFSLLQDQKLAFKKTYIDFMRAQSFALAFFYVPVIIFSDLVASLLLGNAFSSHYIILGLLGVFWFIRVAASNLMGPTALAAGQTKLSFYWNLGVLIPNVSIIYLSSSVGVTALAIALIVFQLVIIPIANKLIIRKIIPVTLLEIIASIGIPVLILAIPLLALKFGLYYIQVNVFLFNESAVATLSLLVSLLTIKHVPSIRGSLLRLKNNH